MSLAKRGRLTLEAVFTASALVLEVRHLAMQLSRESRTIRGMSGRSRWIAEGQCVGNLRFDADHRSNVACTRREQKERSSRFNFIWPAQRISGAAQDDRACLAFHACARHPSVCAAAVHHLGDSVLTLNLRASVPSYEIDRSVLSVRACRTRWEQRREQGG